MGEKNYLTSNWIPVAPNDTKLNTSDEIGGIPLMRGFPTHPTLNMLRSGTAMEICPPYVRYLTVVQTYFTHKFWQAIFI